MKFSCFESIPTPNKEVGIPFGVSLRYSPDGVAHKLKMIDSLTKAEMNQFITEYYDVILDYDFFFNTPEYREAAQKAFSNEQFLLCLLSVAPMLHLNNHQIICCNKLAYDYIQYTRNEEDRISGLLLQLSSVVNRNLVLVLSGIIGNGPAQYLAMVAHSSFMDKKNVRRILNFLIYNIEGYNVQDLLNIYQKLFTRITTFFTETMLYVITDRSKLTDEQLKNDQSITISLLDIMMNMTSAEMRVMLREYGMSYFLHHQGKPVRISLHYLNEQYYARILKVVEELDIYDEIMIP